MSAWVLKSSAGRSVQAAAISRRFLPVIPLSTIRHFSVPQSIKILTPWSSTAQVFLYNSFTNTSFHSFLYCQIHKPSPIRCFIVPHYRNDTKAIGTTQQHHIKSQASLQLYSVARLIFLCWLFHYAFYLETFFRHTSIIARYKYPISISRIRSAIIHHTHPI